MTAGLAPGEEVVTAGADGLSDGADGARRRATSILSPAEQAELARAPAGSTLPALSRD